MYLPKFGCWYRLWFENWHISRGTTELVYSICLLWRIVVVVVWYYSKWKSLGVKRPNKKRWGTKSNQSCNLFCNLISKMLLWTKHIKRSCTRCITNYIHTIGTTIISQLSAHWFKYAIFLDKNKGSDFGVWTCHAMSLPWMHDFLRMTINVNLLNVLLKRLNWSSHFIVQFSRFRLSIRTKRLVVDVDDNAM